MRYRLTQNLGLFDARKCNLEFGAALPLDASKLTAGSTVDLPESAANWLRHRYRTLLETAVSGEAKKAEIKGV